MRVPSSRTSAGTSLPHILRQWTIPQRRCETRQIRYSWVILMICIAYEKIILLLSIFIITGYGFRSDIQDSNPIRLSNSNKYDMSDDLTFKSKQASSSSSSSSNAYNYTNAMQGGSSPYTYNSSTTNVNLTPANGRFSSIKTSTHSTIHSEITTIYI